MTHANSSRNIQFNWPEDDTSVGSAIPLGSVDQASSSPQDRCQMPIREKSKKCLISRPQVIVNFFNNGGPSSGGSCASGSGKDSSGTDDAASIQPGNSGKDENVISRLTSQVAALSKKVEQLSLQTSERTVVVERGSWNNIDHQHDLAGKLMVLGTKESERVNFKKAFKSIPLVTVSLRSLDASRCGEVQNKTASNGG
ncbi:hypothetical protein GQ607_010390 [Colletotrichum asianum]|uniref:Uncharacterized protein n=1 Tax=Colletotrichum asianum TaxID=702518 RepID=A0A8H3W885_9PEZI|nr:hypothetical protein GQ607_010390 [Colletotrichum asianum]